MIAGIVSAEREAIVSLSVNDSSGESHLIEAVLDTGFTDFLTLPQALIAALGLEFRGSTSAVLGDGRVVSFDVYLAFILWDGAPRRVQVLAAEGAPLIGMSLLYGSRVVLDVVDGGHVTIASLA